MIIVIRFYDAVCCFFYKKLIVCSFQESKSRHVCFCERHRGEKMSWQHHTFYLELQERKHGTADSEKVADAKIILLLMGQTVQQLQFQPCRAWKRPLQNRFSLHNVMSAAEFIKVYTLFESVFTDTHLSGPAAVSISSVDVDLEMEVGYNSVLLAWHLTATSSR
jgi:hypothetical protein